jgi:class 3 adenylate cyclase
MIPVFFSLGVREMGFFNIGSVLVYAVAHYIGIRDRFHVSVILTNIEIISHMAAVLYFVGFSAGFQLLFLVVVLAVFIVPTEFRTPTYPFLVIMPAVWIFMRLYMAGRSPVYELPSRVLTTFYTVNVLSIIFFTITSMGFMVLIAASALTKAGIEQRRAERLLLNILPEPIAERLKADESTIADGFAEASIFFCDIVDFTVLSSGKSPDEVVDILNELFCRIDGILDDYSMEKIKTIGDAYMAVCGVPEPVTDHAYKTVSFAEAVQKELDAFNSDTGLSLELRYGVNSGPVVAGIIGTRKFIYDLWGDTVNTASRMESYGVPGRIQITEAVRKRLDRRCGYESRGRVDIKGKGPMETFLVSSIDGRACV